MQREVGNFIVERPQLMIKVNITHSKTVASQTLGMRC